MSVDYYDALGLLLTEARRNGDTRRVIALEAEMLGAPAVVRQSHRDALIRARLARVPELTQEERACQRESFARGNVRGPEPEETEAEARELLKEYGVDVDAEIEQLLERITSLRG